MENGIENADSQNSEVEVETTEETTEATDDKEVAGEELSEREKQFLARAKKAESKLKATKEVKSEAKPIDKSGDNDLREEVFFLKNKEMEEQKDLIKSFQKPGQSLEETIKNPIVKKTLDDLKALKESQTSKSVIHNNARISDGGSDEGKAFQEAQKTGNWADYISKYRS
jgi:hypothetical protein